MDTINPEFRDLQREVANLRDQLNRTAGELAQVNRIASDTSRQTIWQFVIFAATMAALLIGAITYQTNVLRNESNAMRNEFNVKFEALEKRLEQVDKNLNARFDDLKQVVLSDRKPANQPPKR